MSGPCMERLLDTYRLCFPFVGAGRITSGHTSTPGLRQGKITAKAVSPIRSFLTMTSIPICFDYRIDRRLHELGGFWAEEFGVAEPGDGEGEGARGAGLEDVFQQVMKTDRDGVA